MAGLCRMHKHCRGPGRGQGGRNLAPNVPAFSHAHHHHAAAAREHDLHRLRKLGADAAGQAQHGSGLYLKGLAGEHLGLCGVKGKHIKSHARIL